MTILYFFATLYNFARLYRNYTNSHRPCAHTSLSHICAESCTNFQIQQASKNREGRGGGEYRGSQRMADKRAQSAYFALFTNTKHCFYLFRNKLYNIHFYVVPSVGIQSFMDEANTSTDPRLIRMERNSVFPR